MPFLVPFIPAIIGAGAAIYSANASNSASKAATNAQAQATDKSLAAQQAALDRITALQQPFIQAGQAGLPALGTRVAAGAPNFSAPGYAQPQPGESPAPAAPIPAAGGKLAGGPSIDPASAGPPAANSPNWDAYLQAYPDLAAAAQAKTASGEIGPNGLYKTPEEWAAYHYKEKGEGEGRTVPGLAPQAPQTPQDLGTASPVVANYTRPDQGVSPDQANFFDVSKFTTSPGYDWRLQQGQRNLNANFGAKGLLQSGGAIQGAIDYGQNSASAEYQNWFSQQQQKYADAAGQFNINRNNTNNNFAEDRSYSTNLAITNRDFANKQYDTQTANMFQLAGIGANAASAISGAVTNNANNSTNLITNQGNTAAQNIFSTGATNAQLAGTLGSTVSNLFSSPTRPTGGIGVGQDPASYYKPGTSVGSALGGTW